MNAVSKPHVIAADSPKQRSEIFAWQQERIRLITALLQPRRFDQHGQSVVSNFNALLWVLHLHHFTVFSHEGRGLKLSRVLDIRCETLEAFQFMEMTLGQHHSTDRLGEALALHGFEGVTLYFDQRYYFIPLFPFRESTSKRLRHSSLRVMLSPLFHAESCSLPSEYLKAFLALLDTSPRLRKVASERLWWEDGADGSLHLDLIDDEQPAKLATASQALFLLLQRYPDSERRQMLRNLALSLFQTEAFQVPNVLLADWFAVLDSLPLLQEQAAGFVWLNQDDGLLFKPRTKLMH